MYTTLYYRLEELMSREYFLDSNITVGRVASLIGTNRSYLFNLFSKELDITFKEYINGYRLQYADNLISKGDNYSNIDVLELAEICGFKSRAALLKAVDEYGGDGLEFLKNRYLCKKIKTK